MMCSNVNNQKQNFHRFRSIQIGEGVSYWNEVSILIEVKVYGLIQSFCREIREMFDFRSGVRVPEMND